MYLLKIFFLLLLLNIGVYSIYSQSLEKETPIKYRIELIYISDTDKAQPEYIFVIGNSGFKSVNSLKKFIETLPPETTLEWAPDCERFGDEPLLNSEKEMSDFKAFCEKRKIKFILRPSG